MQDLKIGGIQADLVWENRQQNLTNLEKEIDSLRDCDLIVLPEMFSTGFSMHPQDLAEEHPCTELHWMQTLSQKLSCHITGSVMVSDAGQFYNRLYWCQPNGEYFQYDKRHLFSLAGEEKIYTPGSKNIQVELKGWKIRPQICYDLRFPVWARNDSNYDILLYVANWPKKRIQHWQQLLIARAIENQAFVVGINRHGTDGNGYHYDGHSAVIDPQGRVLVDSVDKAESLKATLSYTEITNFREHLSALADRDKFAI